MRAGRHQSSVPESLHFALYTPVAVLSTVAPKLPPPPSSPVKGLPIVWKLFLLHNSLPEVQVLSLFFCLCFFFFLLPYPGTWGISCLLEVWGLLPTFSRFSVGVVSHVDVFLMYLWGRRWSPHLTPPPSLTSAPNIFLHTTFFTFKKGKKLFPKRY